MKVTDWELAKSVGALLWRCDGLDLSQRCRRIEKAGHKFRFMLGVERARVGAILQDLVADRVQAKKELFAVSDCVRQALRKNPVELKRRLVDEKRGMNSKFIYSTLLTESDGGQAYILFRCSRSNKCIVYMLEWSER